MRATEGVKRVARIPDPQGMILRIKRALNPNCSVAQSPYCEQIIAMRMQGVPYLQIERWLTKRGEEHRIPYATIFRNFKSVKNSKHLRVELPLAEELAEQWGGAFDFDAVRRLAGNMVLQQRRIDNMIRTEQRRQKENPNYSDKRIRAEMETLTLMTNSYNKLLKSPTEAAKELQEDRERASQGEVRLTPEALDAVEQLVLDGKINVGAQE